MRHLNNILKVPLQRIYLIKIQHLPNRHYTKRLILSFGSDKIPSVINRISDILTDSKIYIQEGFFDRAIKSLSIEVSPKHFLPGASTEDIMTSEKLPFEEDVITFKELSHDEQIEVLRRMERM